MILISEGSETKFIATPTVMYSEWIWYDSTCLWWAPLHPSLLAFVTFYNTHDHSAINEEEKDTEDASYTISIANVDKGTDVEMWNLYSRL